MIVAAHQPHYMPWLGYLDKVAKADVFIVMDDLQFEAQNFQNRQRMKLAEGAAWLSVPVTRSAQSDRILDKAIAPAQSSHQDWRRRHWRTLCTHYARTPYFERYADALRDIYTRHWLRLVDLDVHMLRLALRWFGIRTPIVRSSQLSLRGTKTDRLIDLCKQLGARCYLSGTGGSTGYLDAEKMGRAGVGVIWQQFTHPVYPQHYARRGFISHLGYLDLLFNCGPAAPEVLFGASHPARLMQQRAA